MNRRPLGREGIDASVVMVDANTFGSRQIDVNDEHPSSLLDAAVKAGIDCIELPALESDAAARQVARGWLRRQPVDRLRVVIRCDLASIDREHAGRDNATPVRIAEALRARVEAMLDYYALETLDLCIGDGVLTGLDESMLAECLGALVRSGLARTVGRSGMSPDGFAASDLSAAPDMVRAPCNLIERAVEATLLPALRRSGIGFIADDPIGPIGPVHRSIPDADAGSTARHGEVHGEVHGDRPDSSRSGPATEVMLAPLKSLARHRDREVAEVLLAWTLQRPGVTHAALVLQVRADIERAARAAALVLSEDEIDLIDSVASAWTDLDAESRSTDHGQSAS